MTAIRGGVAPEAQEQVRRRLHARGRRWTAQRSIVLEALERVDGHVTAAELVERCRAVDPTTTPSTVYRTLAVLEDLGIVNHSHGLEGRQEYHVRPVAKHAHLACTECGRSWELAPDEVRPLVFDLAAGRGFEVAVDHLTVVGRCAACCEEAPALGVEPGGAL